MENNDLVIFEQIKHNNDAIGEFWSARELYKALGYTNWRAFKDVIEKAKASFKTSELTRNYNINDHFGQVVKMVPTGSGAERPVEDYQLSRYACYLIAQNGDSRKEPIALVQSYFNVQTFRQEQFDKLSADEKRLYIRQQVTDWDKKLFRSAKDSGVENYGAFYDAGYLGLYGMRSKEIREKKGLGKDKVLDRAGATELAANLFRITQTDDKLQNEIQDGKKIGDEAATNTHYNVGKIVRKTIEEIGGTMPEDLPPELEHIKKLESRRKEAQKIATNSAVKKNLTTESSDNSLDSVVRKSRITDGKGGKNEA